MSKENKSGSKRGAVAFLVAWVLLGVAVCVVVAECIGLTHIRDAVRPYYEMLVDDPEGFKAYLQDVILPKATEAATIVGMVILTLWPAVSKVKTAATMFDGGTKAAVATMQTAEANREENLAFQAAVRDEISAALAEMKEQMNAALDEQARVIHGYEERATRTEEKIDRLTEMEITAIGGSSELVRKNVAAKAILVGRADVPTERRAKAKQRAASTPASAADVQKGGAGDGKQV